MLMDSDIRANVILTVEYINPNTKRDETHVVTVTSITKAIVRLLGFFKNNRESFSRNTTKEYLIKNARPATAEEVTFFQSCYEKQFSGKHSSIILKGQVEKSLSISSTIHEIEQALKSNNAKDVAKEMRVGITKLRQILSMVGYEYDSSQKKWRYVLMDDRLDQRHRSFWHLDEYGIGNIGNTKDDGDMDTSVEEKTKGNKSNASNISNNNVADTDIPTEEEVGSNMGNKEVFTVDEIAILKRLAARHADATHTVDSTDVLHALKNAPYGSTSKKTFALNDGIIEQLDSFCDAHRVKKSDVLAVALQEFFKKYPIKS